jgi:succinate-acetate transporter protein
MTKKKAPFFRAERDYPIIGALLLLLFKVIVLSSLGVYNKTFFASDVAFSGLSFDLWAIITLIILKSPIGRSASLTNNGKILIILFLFLHILLFFVLASFPVHNSVALMNITKYFMLIGLITGTITYLPPFLVLRRSFH